LHATDRSSLDFGRTVVFAGGGVGDTLTHTAQFEAIARRCAGGRITIACKKARSIRELYKGAPYVEAVIGMAVNEDVSGAISLAQAAKTLRGFDTLFSLHESATVMISAALAGIPRRYGFYSHWSFRSLFLTGSVRAPRDCGYPLVLYQSERLLDHYGLSADLARARLVPADEDQRRAIALVGDRPMIAIGVNSSMKEKQWGAPYVALVRALADRYDVGFVLFGGPDVADVSLAVTEGAGVDRARLIDLPALDYPLSVSHALLARCVCYVGNDSMGLHLSALCGLPTVGLFPATPPHTYSPCFIPLEPEPPGSGVDGLALERVLSATVRAIDGRAPRAAPADRR
jgi:heptosyltransferase-2